MAIIDEAKITIVNVDTASFQVNGRPLSLHLWPTITIRVYAVIMVPGKW